MAADDAISSSIGGEAARRLDAIKRALLAEITQRLARLDQSGGRLVGEADALDNARKIRGQVLDLMREAGQPVVVDAGEQAVMDAADRALMQHAPAPSVANGGLIASVAPDAKASIARSVSGVLDEVAAAFGDGAQAMRRAIDVGVNTGAPLTDVTASVAEALDVTFSKASIAVNMAVRGAVQKAAIMQAERGAEAAGETLYLHYTGPSGDSKIREWCADHVNRVYPINAVKQMQNDLGMPAITWRGGPNCRHSWTALTADDLKAEGLTVSR